jgi:tRNA pseudouridine38-40 synthase
MSGKVFSTAIKSGQKVALALSYDGSQFHGWQSQRKPQVPTVQEALEAALSKIANTSILVQCAGRTDTGVHASHQVVSFDSPVERLEKAWVMGVNSHLPDSIAVAWAKPVDDEFNARFSATARRYRYVILNTPARPALMNNGVTWFSRELDEQAMHEAAQSLIGELDFTSYRAAACQSRTPMRNVHFIDVSRNKDLVIVDIQANAFLHHMVRNVVGVLLEIGCGSKSVEWSGQVLAAKNRSVAAPTASPCGLYLVDVIYPCSFGLPKKEPGPYFLTI